MNKPLVTVALALALLSGFLMWMFGRALEKEYKPGETVRVLVAKAPLAAGTKVTRAQLATRVDAQNRTRSNAVRETEAFAVDGRVLGTALQPGDALHWSDLEGGDGSGRASVGDLVPPGQRALTITVDKASSAGGNLKPDDRVDVFATLPQPGGADVTVSLLQNVTVIATGGELGRNAVGERREGFVTASVLVTPEEAQRLSLAQAKGRLSLVVRNPDDTGTFDGLAAVSLRDLFDGEKTSAIQRKRDEKIEQIRPARGR